MKAPPDVPVLTIGEAAELLRIGRSLAYQLAGEYIASGGVSGLPAVRFGGLPACAALGAARVGVDRPRGSAL